MTSPKPGEAESPVETAPPTRGKRLQELWLTSGIGRAPRCRLARFALLPETPLAIWNEASTTTSASAEKEDPWQSG